MRAEVEDLGGSQKKIVFEVTAEDVKAEVDKYCKQLAREVDIKGFRKGKAPVSLIKRYFKDQIQREVASQIVSSSIGEALKEHSITPLGEPDIDAPALKEGEDFSFSVTMDVRPEIEVSDYEDIEVDKESAEVGEEEVAQALENLRKAHGELKGVEEDREVVEGDTVLVDYTCLLDGEPLSDHERKDVYVETGSGSFRKDAEDALIGARVNDTRDMDVEYPPNYLDKRIAGKSVTYKFAVKKILVKELPALDDDFAKDVGAYDNLDALKDRLREEIRREKETRARKQMEESLLDELVERNPVEAPRSLVKDRHDQLLRDAAGHFLSKGLHLDQESEDYQKLNANLEELAEKEVKKYLLLEAVGKKESVAVADEEIEARIAEIASRHDQSVEKVRADIQKEEDGLERFRANAQREKTLDFLLSRARIKDKASA